MRKAKIIKERTDYPKLKLGDIVYVHGTEKGSAEYQTPTSILIETKDGIFIKIIIDIYWGEFEMLQMLDSPEIPNQLSKETQVQAILFTGYCLLNGMIADNNQRKICNENMVYTDSDFLQLNKDIAKAINELK